MRLIHYNILDGAPSPSGRLERLGAWLVRQQADVVTLNELNGWRERKLLDAMGEAWGFPHRVLHATRWGYDLGVLSRTPIDVLASWREPFHHGALHVETAGLHLLLTHLAPGTVVSIEKRVEEARFLAGLIRGIAEPLAVVGDLNCLSPADAARYAPPNVTFSPDFQQMQCLLDAGLIDTWDRQGLWYTVPTSLSVNAASHRKLRFDYVLANPALAARGPRTRICDDPTLDELSDHRPLECTLGV